MLEQLPLLFGLLLAPQEHVPAMPYLGLPVYGWNERREKKSGLFASVGATALPILRQGDPIGSGSSEHWQKLVWRPVGLVGLGVGLRGDVFISGGAQIGEGVRPYASIGVRFWPFWASRQDDDRRRAQLRYDYGEVEVHQRD